MKHILQEINVGRQGDTSISYIKQDTVRILRKTPSGTE